MNLAILRRVSPFYDLFPGGRVPIINILVPSQAQLEGSAETEVYMVDVPQLTPEQFHGIAFRIADAARVDVWDVRRDMMLRGLPLRASQVCSVQTDKPWFL